MEKKCKHPEEKARQDYAGAQQDAADNNFTDAKEVEQDIKELNDNPRDNNLDM
ncbi:MAG: hypothetical protein K2M07_04445 [Muribaculaceae bacterium]|nr:hypothetical protein [Muribaculaceae bacterium]